MVLPSPRRYPRNQPSPPLHQSSPTNDRNAIGSTARNVMSDFSTPLPLRKLFCDMDNCKGTDAEPDMACILCEAPVHGSCFHGNIRKLKEYPEDCHNEVFCSDLCCIWHGNDKVVIVDVRNERLELQKMLKKSLIELARTAKVKITQ
jgi:hypothetical protein